MSRTLLSKRIWKVFGLKPHRLESFELSTGLRFVEELHLIARLLVATTDNYWMHLAAMIRSRHVRPRFQVHFMPTSSGWINQVECWFFTIVTLQFPRHIATRAAVKE